MTSGPPKREGSDDSAQVEDRPDTEMPPQTGRTARLKPIPEHTPKGSKPDGDQRPAAAVLREALAGGPPAPPVPQDTARVRLVPRPSEPPAWRVILQTAEPTTTKIGLNVWQVLVIGRSDPSGMEPDLDLLPYGGAADGISRQHAMLIPGIDGLFLSDMESTNGTWVNGQFLEPGERHPLMPGDVIDLGLMRLYVRVVSAVQRPGEGSAG